MNFNAQIGDKNTPTASVTHSATRVLEIVGSDLNSNATAMTQTFANIKIGNENYKETNLTINAQNNASRQLNSKSFMLIGGLQIAGGGAVNSISQGADSANVEAGGGNLSNVAINSTAETYSDNYAHSIAPLTIIEFGNKAQARNYFSGTANAKLKGNWNISGDMSVNVKNEDGFDTKIEAGGVQAIGFDGLDSEVLIGKLDSKKNLSDLTTEFSIADGTKIQANNLLISTKNVILSNKNDKYYEQLDALLGGAINAQWSRSDNTFKRNTAINIGKNSNITTTGSQVYEASTQTATRNVSTATIGAAFGGGRVISGIDSNYANKINVGQNSNLSTTKTGNLTFATYDDIVSTVYSQSKFKGLAGVDVVSNATNNLTRKNIIDIGKGVTLNTAKDLNLYA